MSGTTKSKMEGVRQIIFLFFLLFHLNPELGRAAEASKLVRGEAGAVSLSADEVRGPHCFTVDLPESGLWWLTLETRQASTAPSLIILGRPGGDPRAIARFEAMMFEVQEPGEHIVCSTSSAALGQLEVGVVPVGDALEVRVDSNPRVPASVDPPDGTQGDAIEIEIDPDP